MLGFEAIVALIKCSVRLGIQVGKLGKEVVVYVVLNQMKCLSLELVMYIYHLYYFCTGYLCLIELFQTLMFN